MSIVINSLAYIHADGEVLFNDINISIHSGSKASLIGHNGVGKSTLLQIISGNIKQTEGKIILSEKPYMVPQDLRQFDDLSIIEVLRVDDKIKALHEILKGDVSEHNLEVLNEEWDIEEKVNIALKHWNIEHLNIYKKMNSLSGGEKAKVFLAGIIIHSPKIILLDEPTNHLDSNSKAILFDFIKSSKSTFLIVSHDRELLNLVTETVEISLNSIEIYGGNYDFYKQQKKLKVDSLHNQIADKKKELKTAKIRSKEIADQRQKQESRGKEQKIKAGIPRILMGGLKDTAEKSTTKVKNQQNQKIEDIISQIGSIKTQIELEQPLRINIKNSTLHKGKLLVDANNINLSYEGDKLWTTAVSFRIYSGDRILITGNNGAGKTSLIKAVTREISVSDGTIYIAELKSLYIDQEYSIINNTSTVFAQAQIFNNKCLPDHDLKMLLHQHQLTCEYWDRPCGTLSGGEKVKLLLCCLSIDNNSPDILILDEPTNNLDLSSKDMLTFSVKEFDGTIVVISHDKYFIDEIAINKTISL